jgi:hypothetical protein
MSRDEIKIETRIEGCEVYYTVRTNSVTLPEVTDVQVMMKMAVALKAELERGTLFFLECDPVTLTTIYVHNVKSGGYGLVCDGKVIGQVDARENVLVKTFIAMANLLRAEHPDEADLYLTLAVMADG